MQHLSRRMSSLVAATVLVACGCDGRRPLGAEGSEAHKWDGFTTWPVRSSDKLDVLFMIDNSAGMDRAQYDMQQQGIPAFFSRLEARPGGLPDLHVAVITSDMGAGDETEIPNCKSDQGRFRAEVGEFAVGCPARVLPAGENFVATTSSVISTSVFFGTIGEVLECIVSIGTSGCGYEQPLASLARALGTDGAPAPDGNQGFLRPEAALAIVLLSNEDDCSSADPSFYQVAMNTLDAPLGPSGNFRCAEFGHLCTRGGGTPMPPGRHAPNGLDTDTVTYDSCVPAEGAGRLIPVAKIASGIKRLKATPDAQILVASIQGPTTPYQVHWMTPRNPSEKKPWPDVSYSCEAIDGTIADPGIRLDGFARQFGRKGLTFSICENDYGVPMRAIAQRAGQLLGSNCLDGRLRDADNDLTNGVLQPNCTFFDRTPKLDGGTLDTLLPACADNGHTPPCWDLVSVAPDVCADEVRVVIDRGGAPVPDGQLVSFKCAMCEPGVSDPAQGCP